MRLGHAWLRAHDPGYGALRRAGRTALVMPSLVAICNQVFGNPLLATFGAFGSIAMLLLVDFGGPMRDRLRAQASLGVACAALICLGTLASNSTVIAVVGMAIVAFVVLFSAVVSSVIASATTCLLLAFILPVSLPGPVSTLPDRVGGWGLAAAVSLVAIGVLWPAPARQPIRAKAIACCRAIAERLRGQIAFSQTPDAAEAIGRWEAARAAADAAVADLYTTFFATPYRPTGLATSDRAVVRLVDDLRWCNAIVLRAAPPPHPHAPDEGVLDVKRAAADVLDRCAELLAAPGDPRTPLDTAVGELRGALVRLETEVIEELPVATEPPAPGAVVTGLDPSFRAQELSFVAIQIASNTHIAAAATRRSWIDKLLGRQPEGIGGVLSSAGERARAHLERHSIWLHNSLRGSAALALAVLVADVGDVQHAFWVAFAALSVLRSNALATGQTMLRAVLGTTLGFLIGGALVYVIGTDTTVLWILLPFAVLFAGIAPAAISFTVGQASFTMVLLILFNILAPAGWKIGIVRVEDIVIGGLVSLVAGLLFWPRGAGRSLGQALGRAYEESVVYLTAAVQYGVGRCDPLGGDAAEPRTEALAAAAAARRLDDTFRTYLAERGTKQVPLADATRLVTGVTGVRLAGDAVLELWRSDGAHGGERGAARRELMLQSAAAADWYRGLAGALTRRRAVPDPQQPDPDGAARLVEAVARDLQGADGHGTATGVRVIWTGDHLDALRRLERTLVEPAAVALAEGEGG